MAKIRVYGLRTGQDKLVEIADEIRFEPPSGSGISALDVEAAVLEVLRERQPTQVATLVAVGAEMIAGGDFAADTGFTKGTGWTIAAGVADSDASQVGDSDLTQTPAVALVENALYLTSFKTANRTAGNLTVVVGGTEGTDRAGNTTYTQYILAGSGADLDLRADVNWDGDVDDFSVKLVPDVAWDVDTYSNLRIAIPSGVTRQLAAPTNQADGGLYFLHVTFAGAGATLLFSSNFKWIGGSAPTISGTDEGDLLMFFSDGTNMYGMVSAADVKAA